MTDVDSFRPHVDEELSLNDLRRRLTSAELHAEVAEKNAVAAERARSIISVDLRSAQAECNKLRMDIVELKARLEHITTPTDASVDNNLMASVAETSRKELTFSWRLAQPLGKIVDFDLLNLKGGSLVVHPVAFETVVAELDFSPGEPISMIKMEGSLPDERAQPVEYALVAAGEPVTTETPIKEEMSWTLLSPGESSEVVLHLPIRAGQVTALLYLRMLDPNDGHDYCETLWRAILAA